MDAKSKHRRLHAARQSHDSEAEPSLLQHLSYIIITPLLVIIFALMGVVVSTHYWHKLPFKGPQLLHVISPSQLQHTNLQRLKNIIQHWPPLYFFSADLPQLNKQLLLQLPWVKHIHMRKSWPHTLQLTFSEYQPLASWQHDRFIDRSGVLLPKPASDQRLLAQLPALYGPEQQEQSVWDHYLVFKKILSPLAVVIKKVSLSRDRQWTLGLQDGTMIYAGSELVAQRLSRLVKVFASLSKNKSTVPASFDLRYSHAIAIQWKHKPKHNNKIVRS